MTGPAELESLWREAVAVMERAYAPYSGFRVGAVLAGADGSMHLGCNVESSAYPAGMCAERGALAVAVARGVRSFHLLMIATEAHDPTPPCGMCRQALVEFAPGLRVVSRTRGGSAAEWTLAELLPHPFTPRSLEHRA
ncbi:MAG: cytidine deaminase [Gemmatimonadota bacterium]|nr:cytidine deaminase [Gemmatimonadota bacterium]